MESEVVMDDAKHIEIGSESSRGDIGWTDADGTAIRHKLDW